MSNFKDFFRIYTNIISLGKYNRLADKWVNSILDKVESGELKATQTEYTLNVDGDSQIWTSNFPYGYGNPYYVKGEKVSTHYRVSRKTKFRLRKLQNSLLQQKEKALEELFKVEKDA